MPGIAAGAYCSPLSVRLTDIHEPSIANCIYNLDQNFGGEKKQGVSTQSVFTSTENNSDQAPQMSCLNVSWSDASSYPTEPPCDVILGADLVYDTEILTYLIPAVVGILKPGGHFLYLAPDTARSNSHYMIFLDVHAGENNNNNCVII